MIRDFIAIDFETANQQPSSVCSVGVVMPLSHSLFGAELTAPYKVAILLCFVFLVQVWTTRHFQSLPPK